MKLFKWFGREQTKEERTEPIDYALIARKISPVIDSTSQRIIREYHQILLSEPITFIVYAVWGAKTDGELTSEQKQINDSVLPQIKNVMDALGLSYSSPEQKYAVEYIVRSLIISKVTYSIELARNKINQLSAGDNEEKPSEPMELDTTEMLRSFIDQADMDWRRKFRGPKNGDT